MVDTIAKVVAEMRARLMLRSLISNAEWTAIAGRLAALDVDDTDEMWAIHWQARAQAAEAALAQPAGEARDAALMHLNEARAHLSNGTDDVRDDDRAMPQLRECAYHLGMAAAALTQEQPNG